MSQMKAGGMTLAKWAARQALHNWGGLSVVRSRNRGLLRIFCYHRFPAEAREQLDRHCAHLRDHYSPVSMAQVARWVRNGEPLPQNAAAVTVDDGYADFYETGWPVFSRHGIPATMYLTTAFLDGFTWLWFDRLEYAFEHANVRNAGLRVDRHTLRLALEYPERRRAAAALVKKLLKQAPEAERLRVLRELPRVLCTHVPKSPPEDKRPLSWDQVRTLARTGVEFGAHTATHPILSRVPGDQLRDEIAGSKRRIEQELDREVIHFCYPNGYAEDISAEAVDEVERAGFATAVTMQPGLNAAGADPFRLSRLAVDAEYRDSYFRELAAGLHAA